MYLSKVNGMKSRELIKYSFSSFQPYQPIQNDLQSILDLSGLNSIILLGILSHSKFRGTRFSNNSEFKGTLVPHTISITFLFIIRLKEKEPLTRGSLLLQLFCPCILVDAHDLLQPKLLQEK